MVRLLTNAEVRALNLRAGPATITDLQTGRKYDIFWGGQPSNHTDFSPLTPQDTEIMRQISGGWNWHARPVVLNIGGHNLAAAVHHFPHGSIIGGNPGLPNMSNTRPAKGWTIGGHMCLYYKDSTGGTPNMIETARQAFEMITAMNEMIINGTVESDNKTRTVRLGIGSTIVSIQDRNEVLEVPPFVDSSNRTMVPVRVIAEGLGAAVDWDGDSRVVTISLGQRVVTLTIDVSLPGGMGTPVIVRDRTFVPVRFVSESLGRDVHWNENARVICIY